MYSFCSNKYTYDIVSDAPTLPNPMIYPCDGLANLYYNAVNSKKGQEVYDKSCPQCKKKYFRIFGMMRRRYVSIYYILLIIVGFLFVYPKGFAHSDQSLNESFLKAIYAKDFSLMDKLLKEGGDINVLIRNDLTPLAEAAFAGDLEVVDYLLRKGQKLKGLKTYPILPYTLQLLKATSQL